jgi:hypothetical protein
MEVVNYKERKSQISDIECIFFFLQPPTLKYFEWN